MYRERFALTRNGNLDIELADLLSLPHRKPQLCSCLEETLRGFSAF
jgi:hypothetical protein